MYLVKQNTNKKDILKKLRIRALNTHERTSQVLRANPQLARLCDQQLKTWNDYGKADLKILPKAIDVSLFRELSVSEFD